MIYIVKVNIFNNWFTRCKTKDLNKTKIYDGVIACNQPDYKKKGLVFCEDYLLEKSEYKLIKEQANE